MRAVRRPPGTPIARCGKPVEPSAGAVLFAEWYQSPLAPERRFGLTAPHQAFIVQSFSAASRERIPRMDRIKTTTLNGAEIVIRCLQEEGVEYVFGYPGGAVLYIYDELFKQDKVKHVLVRHEQGAVHAADGYSRSSKKIGVALVTSGPGVTNAVTGIATAYMDSIPMVVLTGQVPTHAIGLDAFQQGHPLSRRRGAEGPRAPCGSRQGVARHWGHEWHVRSQHGEAGL